MPEFSIVLSTLNARYSHAALGLRYLQANLGEYQEQCSIQEYTIQARPLDVVESLLAANPTVVGLSIYIWNRRESLAVLQALKTVAPDVVVVLGGPEVSHGDESDADANRGGCGKEEEGAATGGSAGVRGSCTFAAGVVDVSSWARAEVDHVRGTDGGHGRSPQCRNELQRKEERRTWESGGGERTAWGSGTIEGLRERSVFDGD